MGTVRKWANTVLLAVAIVAAYAVSSSAIKDRRTADAIDWLLETGMPDECLPYLLDLSLGVGDVSTDNPFGAELIQRLREREQGCASYRDSLKSYRS